MPIITRILNLRAQWSRRQWRKSNARVLADLLISNPILLNLKDTFHRRHRGFCLLVRPDIS